MRLMERASSPGKASYQDQQGSEEGAGEIRSHCIAQVLFTAPVLQSIGTQPVGGVAQQRALGPWEAAFPFNGLILVCGMKEEC